MNSNHNHLYIIVGNQSATAGKTTTIASLNKSAQKKGAIPLKIFVKETSGNIDFKIKTFNPIGGVIKLISTTITKTMPHHISTSENPKSRPIITGTKIGTVRNIIATPSINMPKST